MPTVILSIGSNAGDSLREIKGAIRKIGAGAGRISGVSPYYRTAPIGYRRQSWFYNLAVRLETALPLRQLAARLRGLEAGKKAAFRNGPRKLDLDILFYGDLVFRGRDLRIPHERIEFRRFVMEPLARLAPGFVHPGYSLPVRELYRRFRPRFRAQQAVRLAPCRN